MNDDTRAAIADLAIIGVTAVALYYVARNPPLRRAVWRALTYGALTWAPRIVWDETTRAWAASAQVPDSDSRFSIRNS